MATSSRDNFRGRQSLTGVGRGLLRERMGQVREASADLAAACLLEPSNAAFLRNRGVNARTNGDYPAALSDLTHVLRLAPADTVALANRGCRSQPAIVCRSAFLLSAMPVAAQITWEPALLT